MNEYDTQRLGDISLNRCTAARYAFVPQAFKLGIPPNKDNDCAVPDFILTQANVQENNFGAFGPAVIDPVALAESEGPELLPLSAWTIYFTKAKTQPIRHLA